MVSGTEKDRMVSWVMGADDQSKAACLEVQPVWVRLWTLGRSNN